MAQISPILAVLTRCALRRRSACGGFDRRLDVFEDLLEAVGLGLPRGPRNNDLGSSDKLLSLLSNTTLSYP